MRDLIGGHRLIAIDTCVWIYHLANNPEFIDLTSNLLYLVETGQAKAVVSELTLLEILVRPFQLERADIADEYETLLIHFPNLRLVPISRDILIRAASLRAKYRLRTPDAMIVATAIQQGATRIITNDEGWKGVTEMDVICLHDFK